MNRGIQGDPQEDDREEPELTNGRELGDEPTLPGEDEPKDE